MARDQTTAPRSEKPSIAVLPFTNISGDKEQDYFADGLADDLTTRLCKLPGLLVISRHSAFTFKGRSVAAPEIAVVKSNPKAARPAARAPKQIT